ncbi:Thermonuclease precursor [Gemmata sp. SH-PL17]|uniref:thermonuclease family protein n=1 Tax=Gemmata sp. SH-PL17 TaxID=1630693 RepID=UPI00078E31E7|nr:thermonuclease family protein [Gemmata sp. SH-PL17]AMV24005.1 Thermonuclease precursor [Gemmata sp. SH-PL17]
MRPNHVRTTLLFIPVLLVATFFAHADEKKKDLKSTTAYKVLRTIDGDTIEVEKDGKPVKVRLIGVDTPETVHPSKPVEQYGKEASRFTSNLLKGESVYLELDAKPDKYGRALAFVYRAPDVLFVNAEIIRQGYGFAYTRFPFDDDLMKQFRAHEKSAREAGRGLWGSADPIDGKDTKADKVEPKDVKSEVYVTSSGAKYHADGCKFLAKSKILCSLADAKAKKYEPCSVCNPPK